MAPVSLSCCSNLAYLLSSSVTFAATLSSLTSSGTEGGMGEGIEARRGEAKAQAEYSTLWRGLFHVFDAFNVYNSRSRSVRPDSPIQVI